MNRAAALSVSFCLFCLAAVTAWLTGARSPEVERGRMPALPESAGRVLPEALSQQDWRERFERELTGGAPPRLEPCSVDVLTDLYSASFFEFDGESRLREHVEGWLRRDSAAVCAVVERLRVISVSGMDFTAAGGKIALIFDTWAKLDAGAATAAARHFSQRGTRARALESVVRVLSETDPERARRLFVEHMDLLGGDYGAVNINSDGGAEDPEFLRSLPPGRARANFLSKAIVNTALYSAAGREQAAASWRATPRELQKEVLAAFAARGELHWNFTPYNPEIREVFTGLEELNREMAEEGNARDVGRFIGQHGDEWARRDLPAAVAWVHNHAQGVEAVSGVVKLFGDGAAGNFEATQDLWLTLPDGVLKARAAGAILKAGGTEHEAEAEGLIGTLSAAHREMAERERFN